MEKENLYYFLKRDLKALGLPTDEVLITLRPYSKTYYGCYYPLEENEVGMPRVWVYPYSNKIGDLLPYSDILNTGIHEMCHHLQYINPNWKRKRGVMHDTQFWKLYEYYTKKAERKGLYKKDFK